MNNEKHFGKLKFSNRQNDYLSQNSKTVATGKSNMIKNFQSEITTFRKAIDNEFSKTSGKSQTSSNQKGIKLINKTKSSFYKNKENKSKEKVNVRELQDSLIIPTYRRIVKIDEETNNLKSRIKDIKNKYEQHFLSKEETEFIETVKSGNLIDEMSNLKETTNGLILSSHHLVKKYELTSKRNQEIFVLNEYIQNNSLFKKILQKSKG